MRSELHDDEGLGGTPEPDSFEVEGIQAFNRLTTAVTGLQSRLVDLELGLGRKASQAERVAARAEEAAQAARTVVEHARGVATRQSPFSRLLGRPGRSSGRSGGRGCWLLARAHRRT